MATYEQLNTRERLFVEHYLLHENGTRAALAAGYAKSGASVQASRMLDRPRIQEALHRRRANVGVETDEIVAGIAFEAHYAEKAADRLRAYEMLARIKGMFKDESDDAKVFTLRIEGPGVAVPPKADELPLDSRQVVQ